MLQLIKGLDRLCGFINEMEPGIQRDELGTIWNDLFQAYEVYEDERLFFTKYLETGLQMLKIDESELEE
jgi:hypothetical protein